MNLLLRRRARFFLFLLLAWPVLSGWAQNPNWKPPGTEENQILDRAKVELDRVYQSLLKSLDEDRRREALRTAQSAWTRWSEAEASFSAAMTSAGGSAFRVDRIEAETRLVKERTALLRQHLSPGR